MFSLRGSISVTNDDSEVTNVMVSLPPSKTNSRGQSPFPTKLFLKFQPIDISSHKQKEQRGSL